jgi:hypothetical protein
MTNQKAIRATEVELRELAPLGVTAALWLVALVLLCRAAIVRSPSPLVASALSAVVFGIGVGAWTWDERRRRTADLRDRVARGLAAVAAPLIIGLTSAGSSPFAMGLTIALAVLSGVWVVWSSSQHADQATTAPVPALDSRVLSAASRNLTEGDDAYANVETEASSPVMDGTHLTAGAPLDDSAVSQQIVRRATESTGDSIEALLRVRFEAGVKEAVIQLPIHPPLAGPPRVECEPLDSTDLTCTVTAARRFGVRIEVRRPAPLEQPLTALIGVEIHIDSAADAAA